VPRKRRVAEREHGRGRSRRGGGVLRRWRMHVGCADAGIRVKTNQKQLYVAYPDVPHRVGFFIIYITYNVGLQYVYKTVYENNSNTLPQSQLGKD
jgi:hypothetical protein